MNVYRENKVWGRQGFTMVELLVVIALISIIVAIGMPMYGKFAARDRVRRVANDLIQNMRLARAMAIKENRAYTMRFYPDNNLYMFGFDANTDDDLLDETDTYGYVPSPPASSSDSCADTDAPGTAGYRLPDSGNNDIRTVNGLSNVRECVKVVDLNTYGEGLVRIGTRANFDPSDVALAETACNDRSACFPYDAGATNTWVVFLPNGSVGGTATPGYVYFEHVDSGYSYCVRVFSTAGAIDLWAWNGEEPDTVGADPIQPESTPNWRQVR